MRIFIHADTDAFTARIGSKDAPSTIRLKAGIAETRVEVVFHRDSAAVSLPEGAAGRICLKELGKYDSSPLAYAEGWTLEGAGATAIYVFQLNLNGVDLLALLNSGDGDPDNDSAWVDLMLEIEWTASGSVHKTQNTPRVRIHHPVIHDYDGTPAAINAILEFATDAEKLAVATTPRIGQLVRITGEGDRIEQFLGGSSSEQTSWLVLRPTVNLTISNAGTVEPTINGVVCPTGEDTPVGFVDPLAIPFIAADATGMALAALSLGAPYGTAQIYIDGNLEVAATLFAIPLPLPSGADVNLMIE